jgi:hypothetical protein
LVDRMTFNRQTVGILVAFVVAVIVGCVIR